MEKKHIFLGADHGGFELKEKIKSWLTDWGYEFEDMGAESLDKDDDYPIYAFAVAKKVASNPGSLGILVCRSGGGMIISANKIKKIRAVTIMDEKSSKHAKEHNDANVVSLSADWLDETSAKNTLKIYLETSFTREERHSRRLAQIFLEEN